jgi:hypothetical protein
MNIIGGFSLYLQAASILLSQYPTHPSSVLFKLLSAVHFCHQLERKLFLNGFMIESNPPE